MVIITCLTIKKFVQQRYMVMQLQLFKINVVKVFYLLSAQWIKYLQI